MNTVVKADRLSVQFKYFDPSASGFRAKLAALVRPSEQPSSGYVNALTGISFDVQKGDRLAFLGANGSGKTTLLKSVAGILPPTNGRLDISGNINAVFDPGLGMDPEASGLENIKIRLVLAETPTRLHKAKLEEIAEFSELGEALNRPLKTYSSGMAVRLSFSIATAIEPDIMVMDEWLSAGDVRFVNKALHRMRELVEQSTALLIASHSQDIIENWCNRAIWLDNGRVMLDGKPKEVFSAYAKTAS